MSGQIIPLSEVTISTSLAADNVSNAFSLTGTLLGPQPLSVIFDMGWDGGDVTITGTAVNPRTLEVEAWFEVVSSAPGDTVETERAFAVVTAASKSALGATANMAQIKALWPTRAPIEPAAVTQPLSTGGFVPMQGNVYGAQQIKANMVVLKAAVANGEVELTPIFWQDGRWWPQVTETPETIGDRAREALGLIETRHRGTEDRVCLIGHIEFGRVLFHRLLDLNSNRSVTFTFRNASFSQIRWLDEARKLIVSVNDVHHLPVELWTT